MTDALAITLIIVLAFVIAWMLQVKYQSMLNREKSDFTRRKLEKEADIQRLARGNNELVSRATELEGELSLLREVVDTEEMGE